MITTVLAWFGAAFIVVLVFAFLIFVWIVAMDGLLQRRARIQRETQLEADRMHRAFLLEAAKWMSECPATHKLLTNLAHEEYSDFEFIRGLWRNDRKEAGY